MNWGGTRPSAKRYMTVKRRLTTSNANDDKSPLIDLLTCIECKVTMIIAKSQPDANGSDLVQYRCACGRIELVRLIRRSRDAAA